jgi:hypothetical protein
MSKFIISLLTLLILSPVLAKNTWECTSGARCLQNQTCCKVYSNIFANSTNQCFNITDGVCCKYFVCPSKHNCGRKNDKCKSNSLEFLEIRSNEPVFYHPLPTSGSSLNSALDFLSGFYNEFGLLNVTSINKCSELDPLMISDLQEIIKNYNSDSDLLRTVIRVLNVTLDIYSRSAENLKGCTQYTIDVLDIVNKLKVHIQYIDYESDLLFHTLFNFWEIQKRFQEVFSLLNQGNYLQSGRLFGGLVKFGFFWNFRTNVFNFIDITDFDSRMDPKQSIEFMKGLNDGFTFFNNLPHSEECKYDENLMAKYLTEFLEKLKNYKPFSDPKKLVEDIIKFASEFLNNIEKYPGCKHFSHEIEKVYDKIEKHLTSKDYAASLFLHTMMNTKELDRRQREFPDLYKDKKFYELGNAIGDLIKYGLLWSYNKY